MKRVCLIMLMLSLFPVTYKVNAQDAGYSITPALPFMLITPDARSSSMGEIGVSSSPDVYSMHWNPAKYAFIQDDFSVGLAYGPWLRELVSDMNIAYLGISKRVSPKSTVATTFRCFSYGEIIYADEDNDYLGTNTPKEWTIDVAYSQKLGKYISGAVAGRLMCCEKAKYVAPSFKSVISVAVDIGVYYSRPVYWFNAMDAIFSWGVSINNIGPKVTYDNGGPLDKDFLPTNLRLGPTLKLNIDENNSLAFSVDLNKLLVPIDKNEDDIDDIGVFAGMIKSFYDAPGGLREEMKELTIGAGFEYAFKDRYMVRIGYFHEGNKTDWYTEGDYFTTGIGARYKFISADISYLSPIKTSSEIGIHPNKNTMKIGLTFYINKWGNNTKLEIVD